MTRFIAAVAVLAVTMAGCGGGAGGPAGTNGTSAVAGVWEGTFTNDEAELGNGTIRLELNSTNGPVSGTATLHVPTIPDGTTAPITSGARPSGTGVEKMNLEIRVAGSCPATLTLTGTVTDGRVWEGRVTGLNKTDVCPLQVFGNLHFEKQ
jgi:hypothetical protein